MKFFCIAGSGGLRGSPDHSFFISGLKWLPAVVNFLALALGILMDKWTACSPGGRSFEVQSDFYAHPFIVGNLRGSHCVLAIGVFQV